MSYLFPLAALDDSMFWPKNKIFPYVYSHALAIENEIPLTLIISGTKDFVRSQESEIRGFLQENLPENCILYACNHYIQHYPDLEDLISFSRNEIRFPRQVELLFQEAHKTARYLAKSKFHELLNSL